MFVPVVLFLFALQTGPSSEARQLLRDGLVALQHRDLATAQQDLQQATVLAPKDPYVWASLAQVFWKQGQKSEAVQSADKAAQYGGNDPAVAHGLAIFYTEAQEFSKAAALEKTYAESPAADREALGRAAQLFLNAGNASEAVDLAKKNAQANPSAASEDLLGRALLAEEDNSDAVAHLAAAYKVDPTNPSICFDYAHVLLEKQDFSTAAQVLQPASQANQQDPQLMLALGVARYGQRRFDEAITAFLKTIQLDPSIPQPYVFLGRVLAQAGSHLAEITADYQAWYKRYPNRYEPAYLLAKAQLVNGNTVDAERLLRQSIAENDHYWASHFELGQLLAKQHHYPEAAAELRHAIELSPKEPMPHYHLARVYERMGQPDKAKQEREIHAQLTAAKPAGGMNQ